MRYPAGSDAGKKLFRTLEEHARNKLYDDEYLQMLVEYQQTYPNSEHFDIFYAKYALFHGNYAVALEHTQRAYKKRKICLEIWKLFVECYSALGRLREMLLFQGYCCNFYKQPLQLTIPRKELEQGLDLLSLSLGRGTPAPLCESRMFFDGKELKAKRLVFGGEFLPVPADSDGYSYWVGVYNELAGKGTRGQLLEREMTSGQNGFFESDDFIYDIMRSKVLRETVVDPRGDAVIVPISSAEPGIEKQSVEFRFGKTAETACLGQWEYSFFRIDKKTRISSDCPLVFGRPIYLRHSSRRKRLVLNILVDGLSWNAFRLEKDKYMPHMMKFFSKGIIFGQHFSVSEYTYPSLPTIETGMYPHHSQVFHERAAIQLDEEYRTLSEQMNALGYYCVNAMGGGHAIYNGTTRGYDRMLVNFCDLSAYVGVERVIRFIDAFSECDQFIFLHLMEAHPWPAGSLPFPLETQTKLSLKERTTGVGAERTSVRLPNAVLYQEANRQGVMHVDRSLGVLFDYLASRYEEEDYIVQLYSDHGVSIYDAKKNLLGDNQTGAAYMLRGSSVPSLGIVDEMTSSADIYPVTAKLAGFSAGDWVDGNLPAVFGGKERDHVISYSLFPGQTYKLCIRTKTHECYMESLEPVDEDGTVDLSGAKASIRTRGGPRQRVRDPGLEEYFLGLIQKYTASINHEGRQWNFRKQSRPEEGTGE